MKRPLVEWEEKREEKNSRLMGDEKELTSEGEIARGRRTKRKRSHTHTNHTKHTHTPNKHTYTNTHTHTHTNTHTHSVLQFLSENSTPLIP